MHSKNNEQAAARCIERRPVYFIPKIEHEIVRPAEAGQVFL